MDDSALNGVYKFFEIKIPIIFKGRDINIVQKKQSFMSTR